MTLTGYVGTYTTGKSQGIYKFNFDETNNTLQPANLFKEILSPKYLCFAGKDKEFIATVCDFKDSENQTKSGITLLNKNGQTLSTITYENTTSCYIAYKDQHLYTANYHEGTISIIKIEKDNTLKLVHKTLIKEKAGCHQVIFHQNKILVPCLFLDKIIILNENYEIESHIQFPENSGPRHAVFSYDNKYMYVVGELDNMVYSIDIDTMKIVSTAYILENNQKNLKDSAAIRINYEKNLLYISTRTQDVISTFKINKEKLHLQQNYPAQGEHPRDFEIMNNIAFVANRLTDSLTTIQIQNGLLSKPLETIQIPEAISIILENN